MPTGRNAKIDFKKESAWGTYIAGDVSLRASSESFSRKIEHAEDAALIEQIYTTEMIKVSDGYEGGFESAMHGESIGLLLKGVLGAENSVSDPIISSLLVSYNGAVAYARIKKVLAVVEGETSVNGSVWSSAFTFDTSTASYDTMTELQAAIAGVADWECVLLGSGTIATTNISAFSAVNIKNNSIRQGAYLMSAAISASTVSKTHVMYPADSSTEIPSFCFTVNRGLGTNKSLGYTGYKISSVTLSASAKDLCKISASGMGKEELENKNDLSVTPSTVQAFSTPNMTIVIEANDGTLTVLDECKDFSLVLNTNIDENRNIGSYYINEQTRQGATIETSFTANNTTGSYAIRTNYVNDNAVGIYVYYKGLSKADEVNVIPYSVFVRLPSVKLKEYNSPASSPDRLTISASGTAELPKSTVYPKHIYFTVTDSLLTTY